MKRIIFILTLALVGVSASAQNNIYKAVVGVHKNAEGSVVVSDPSTTLAVDLTFETEQVVVGPYAKYAQKYLETRGALVDIRPTVVCSVVVLLLHGLNVLQCLFFCLHRPNSADKPGFFLYEFILAKAGRHQIFIQGSTLLCNIVRKMYGRSASMMRSCRKY